MGKTASQRNDFRENLETALHSLQIFDNSHEKVQQEFGRWFSGLYSYTIIPPDFYDFEKSVAAIAVQRNLPPSEVTARIISFAGDFFDLHRLEFLERPTPRQSRIYIHVGEPSTIYDEGIKRPDTKRILPGATPGPSADKRPWRTSTYRTAPPPKTEEPIKAEAPIMVAKAPAVASIKTRFSNGAEPIVTLDDLARRNGGDPTDKISITIPEGLMTKPLPLFPKG